MLIKLRQLYSYIGIRLVLVYTSPIVHNQSNLMSQATNVNPKEIEKFEKVASHWWDLEGDFKPLHQINPLRLQFIIHHMQDLWYKKIIDVGCGGGILTESMAKLGAHVSGIDMGTEPLNVAKLHALETGLSIDYQKITAEQKASQAANSFDAVTCMEMLEHVPDPASIVKACSRLVKPGGYVFFSTLNNTVKSYLMAIIAAEKILKLVPDGTHDHQRFIRPSQLISWAHTFDLNCIDTSGISYNPVTENHKLIPSLDVNYILCCQKV